MLFLCKTKQIKKEADSGFSLIELMVTIGIITLVTGIVMVKYSAFNSVVILKSQAYELALDIREAQVFGVSASRGAGGSYREAYGIYVDFSNKNEYVLFQDASDNLLYDPGEEIGETYTIDPRFVISALCTTAGVTKTCASSVSDKVSIAFKRPNFDARMWSTMNPTVDFTDIEIASINDPTVTRTVTVYASGQISVQ